MFIIISIEGISVGSVLQVGVLVDVSVELVKLQVQFFDWVDCFLGKILVGKVYIVEIIVQIDVIKVKMEKVEEQYGLNVVLVQVVYEVKLVGLRLCFDGFGMSFDVQVQMFYCCCSCVVVISLGDK